MYFKFQSKFIKFTKFQIRSLWTTLKNYKNEKDYYAILQVSPNATKIEIHEAFTKLTKIYDPDGKKSGRAGKAAKIREITEAYRVLSDVTTRIKYDEALEEMKLMKILRVEDQQQFRPVKIGDVVKVEITHMQSLRGVTKQASANITVKCRKCEGHGMLYANKSVTCKDCKGTGAQNISGYDYTPVLKCLTCRGKGITNRAVCDWCNSTGRVVNISRIPLRLSPGRNNGDIVKLKYGKSTLTALVEVKPESHQHFTREGLNIFSEVEIPLSKAILGGLVYVKGIYGGATITLQPGLLCGARLVFPRKGIRKANSQLTGYHIAVIRVNVPKKLTDAQRSLIKDLF